MKELFKRIWCLIRFKKYVAPPAPVAPPVPRVFIIPQDKVREFMVLRDIHEVAGKGDMTAKHDLWVFIGELYPPAANPDSAWRYRIVTCRKIMIIENLDK